MVDVCPDVSMPVPDMGQSAPIKADISLGVEVSSLQQQGLGF